MNEEFHKLVVKDIKGEASEAEEDLLWQDPENWHSELVAIVQGLDLQLTERKAEYIKKQTPGARQAYEAWKGDAIRFKLATIGRMSEAKEARTELRTSGGETNSNNHGAIFVAILAELKALRQDLAKHK